MILFLCGVDYSKSNRENGSNAEIAPVMVEKELFVKGENNWPNLANHIALLPYTRNNLLPLSARCRKDMKT
jgi:hypothetical protein